MCAICSVQRWRWRWRVNSEDCSASALLSASDPKLKNVVCMFSSFPSVSTSAHISTVTFLYFHIVTSFLIFLFSVSLCLLFPITSTQRLYFCLFSLFANILPSSSRVVFLASPLSLISLRLVPFDFFSCWNLKVQRPFSVPSPLFVFCVYILATSVFYFNFNLLYYWKTPLLLSLPEDCVRSTLPALLVFLSSTSRTGVITSTKSRNINTRKYTCERGPAGLD